MKKLLACLGLVMAIATTGCTLYFGPDDDWGDDDDTYTYCDETGCYWCDDYGCTPTGPNGYYCSSNYDCAAGCYCDPQSGTCVEQGYCSVNEDCPAGFVCDDRASCIPDGTNPGYCTADDQCGEGQYCDEWSGTCQYGQYCGQDAACPDGYYCDDRGVCQPLGCQDDSFCAPGCYCDENTGLCQESGYCAADAECGEGYTCDEERGTCIPTPPNPGSCAGEVVCDLAAPVCAEGQTPLIKDGCYTGECILIEDCDVPPPPPPPPACNELATEDECLAREADCAPAYTGVRCTDTNPNDGLSCTDAPQLCVCEDYYFAACVSTAPEAPPAP